MAVHARPEVIMPGAASQHYSRGEAQRYTAANRLIQHELTLRCLGFVGLTQRQQLIIDLGCGSCLSSQVIAEAGHVWIGLDIARDMLLLGNASTNGGKLVHADLAAGLCLRPGCRLDGAVSVSVLQWLCEPQVWTRTVTV